MARRILQTDPIAANARKAVAQRRVGAGAKCECGESRPEALIPKDDDVMCAECARKKKGKITLDNHHVAGKANSGATVPVRVNDHRGRLSVDQYEWPKRTLENPHHSPLLAAAACIRGFINTVNYLMEEILSWITEMLERLDEYLCESLGSQWWLNTELKAFVFGGFRARN